MMNVMSKDQFCKYIKQIQDAWEYDDECMKAAERHNIEFSQTDASNLAFVAVEALEWAFGCYQDYGDISYFCFELNFGRDYEPGSVTDKDKDGNVTDVDFSSAEKLYDYLVNKLKE